MGSERLVCLQSRVTQSDNQFSLVHFSEGSHRHGVKQSTVKTKTGEDDTKNMDDVSLFHSLIHENPD